MMKNIICLFVFSFTKGQTSTWKEYCQSQSFCDNSLVLSGDNCWVGTDYGLVRFDKTNNSLTVFDKSNTALTKDNISEEMVEDKEGNIWILSRTGMMERRLLRYSKNGDWKTFTDIPDMPIQEISNLRAAQNGGVLFSCGRSIYLFNGSTLKKLEIGDIYSSFFLIYDIIADNNQISWVSTTDGLYKTDIEKQEKELIRRMNCRSLALDSSDNLWIATVDSGMYKYENNVFVNYNPSNSGLHSNNVALMKFSYLASKMKFDLAGNLWLSTPNGLIRYDGHEWKTYEMVDSDISANEIFNFETDQDAISFIWKGNLIRFDGTTTNEYKIGDVKSTFYSDYISSLAFDKKDNLWITNGYDHLQCMKNDIWTNYSLKDSLILDSIFSRAYTDSSSILWSGEGIIIKYSFKYKWNIYNTENRHRGGRIIVDSSNAIWEATGDGNGWGKGILKYVNGKKIAYNTINSPLPTNQIGSLIFDKNEKLLVSTLPVSPLENGSLLSFDANSCDTISFYQNGCDTIVTCSGVISPISSMIYDNDWNLWCGVMGGGLYKLNGKNVYNYSIWNSPISSNSVVSLNMDKKNNLLVGSYGGGLDVFDRVDKWTNFNSKNSPIGFNSIENIEINSLGGIAVSVQQYGFIYIPSDTEVGISPQLENPDSFLKIFPNPVKNDLYLTFNSSKEANMQTSLFDMNGRLVIGFTNQKVNNGNQTLHYNLEGRLTANQIYILNITVNEKQYRKKIVCVGE